MKTIHSVKKIKNIPFQLSKDDEVLLEGFSHTEIESILDYLGYGNAKRKIIDGVTVFYKTRRNGVYISLTAIEEE